MAKTAAQLVARIEELKRQLTVMQKAVITRIRREIAKHGLTPEDLFGAGSAAKAPVSKPKAALSKPKFGDGNGNTWSGMGKRPTWLKQELEAGRALEEFLLERKASTKRKGSPVAVAPVKDARKQPVKVAAKTPAAKHKANKAPAAKKKVATKAATKPSTRAATNKAAPKPSRAKTAPAPAAEAGTN